MTDDRDTYPTAELRSARMYHPILNTIANVVTAVCAVAIAFKVY